MQIMRSKEQFIKRMTINKLPIFHGLQAKEVEVIHLEMMKVISLLIEKLQFNILKKDFNKCHLQIDIQMHLLNQGII